MPTQSTVLFACRIWFTIWQWIPPHCCAILLKNKKGANAYVCTAASYRTKDLYFGRNLDYEFSYGDE